MKWDFGDSMMRNYTLLGCLIEMPRWLRVCVELETGLGFSGEEELPPLFTGLWSGRLPLHVGDFRYPTRWHDER